MYICIAFVLAMRILKVEIAEAVLDRGRHLTGVLPGLLEDCPQLVQPSISADQDTGDRRTGTVSVIVILMPNSCAMFAKVDNTKSLPTSRTARGVVTERNATGTAEAPRS
jgi:hypothetical protein